MGMLLPFAYSWAVRCAKCGHTGTATTADLAAAKPLRCASCGHRQSFAPERPSSARGIDRTDAGQASKRQH
jgi:DNA-directed RNA polymerase subunit RPC12/RpoP